MTIHLSWFACGLLFGAGMCVSGMTDPRTVQAFLEVTGVWNPSLLFVLGGAVTTTFIGYRVVLRRPRPILATAFRLPDIRIVDRPLLTGAAAFGVG